MKLNLNKLLVCSMLCILTGSVSFAQAITTSGIRGQVTDGAGNPIEAVQIQITHLPTNSSTVSSTGPNGRFSADGLRAGGPYQIRATTDGYKPSLLTNLNLDLGRSLRVTLEMKSDEEVYELPEFVVDASESTGFYRDSIGPGASLSSDQIEAAPSASEALSDVIRLNPFVTIGDTERLEINAVGQHYRQNSIQIDGININDQFGLEASGFPALNNPLSLRTIGQLSVDVAPYDVRNSGFTGVSVNAVTKSGTNEFSGEVYYYYSDEDLRGENVLTGNNEPYDETTYGISLGGPIIKDRLFFFVNYEKFERNQLPDDPGFIPDADAVEQVRQRLLGMSTTAYPGGYDPGTWGSVGTSTEEDEKWLGKIDWQINDQHRLTVRYSSTEAVEPDFGEYNDPGETALTSHFFDVDYSTEAYAAELNSQWTSDFQTQVLVAKDTFDKTPTYRNQNLMPEIHIRDFPGTTTSGADTTGRLYFGSEDSRQANNLAVETTKAKAIGVYSLDKHTLTFGVDMEETEFDNLFLQDVYGDFSFRSGGGATALENFLDPDFGVGNRVTRRTGVVGQEIAAQSDFTVTGFFLQTEWLVGPKLELLFGLRYDDVSTDKKPAYNADFSTNFVSQDGRTGFNNSNTIDGDSQISPRFGFRYELDDAGNQVIRGGIGLFQGKVPGVYLSNAFSNNGVTTGSIFYDRSMTLQNYLDTYFDPSDPILFVDEPSGANVDLVDDDFELPSLWRANLAYETVLPMDNWSFIAEFVYSKVNKGVYVEQLNLEQVGTSPDGRALYAGNPFFGDGFDSDYSDVYNLVNTNKGDSMNLALTVQRSWVDNWYASFSYTYGTSTDVSSVTSSTAFSNYANRAIFNANEDVEGTSNYETRHRFLVQGGYEFDWSDRTSTKLVLVYEGRSGRPYSYVFAGDFNNDGVDSNDLFYVPSGPGDPNIGFAAGTTQAQIDNFFAFIESSSLASSKGGTPDRNSETSAFLHRFDVNITQEIQLSDKLELELFLNIINIGNLLNDEWGRTSEVAFPYAAELYEASVEDGKIVYDLDATRDSEEVQTSRSRWQVRVGANLKF